MNREETVTEFNRAVDNKTFVEGGNILPFASGFAEEVGEFGNAIQEYLADQTEETRANLVKEWADVQVVLSNLAWFFNIPGDKAFDIVHQNNMSKLHSGKVLRREDGKVLKPEGYVPADTRGL